MASLILAAGFLTYNKVMDKKEKRREKKKKLHAEWFEDLQKEHSRGMEEKDKRQSQSHSPQKTGGSNNPFESQIEKAAAERRSSSESRRSQDGPDKWVDEVNKERRKSLGVTGEQ